MLVTQEKKNLIKRSKYTSTDLLLRKIRSVQAKGVIEKRLKQELIDNCKSIKQKELQEIVKSPGNFYFMQRR